MRLKIGEFGYIVDNSFRPTKVKVVRTTGDQYVVQRIGSRDSRGAKREVFSSEEAAKNYRENVNQKSSPSGELSLLKSNYSV